MKIDLSTWPEIDREQIRKSLSEVSLDEYSELAGYSREDVHADLAGQGGLFLAADMARHLKLRPDMCVLDLGCGGGATSVFLAKEYGVRVFAMDAEVRALLEARVAASGVAERITVVRADARDLPFAKESFDAVFCMNAFFYFGADERFPSYLMEFLKPEGEVVIGSPCYREELTQEVPCEFLLDFPDCLSVHSPDWWRMHFEKASGVVVMESRLHPRGRTFWEERVRFLIEKQNPRDMPSWKRNMVHDMIRMLNRDADGFVSHFILHAKKETSN